MLIPYDFLALGAAACWALSSVTSVAPSRHLGAFAFARWRVLSVAVLMWTIVAFNGGWRTLCGPAGWPLVWSGLLGIFVGDAALFAAMNRLGPRRCGVLFATHAVFSAVLGLVWLGETMGAQAALGAALTLGGVMTAVLAGQHKDEDHAWERHRGHFGAGVALALLAALCQALGSFIAKPAMAAGVDPIAASALRATVACGAHFLLLALGVARVRAREPVTVKVLAHTALNGLVGMGLGMSLVLLALRNGDVGMVAILSSVSPVLLLPLLWLHLGRAPAPGAWLGAVMTVAGTAAILAR
ncbi:MAG: DMT family transporter [Betaproteobacteria bacterium]